MMEMRAVMVPPTGELSAKLIHKDGTVEDLGIIARDTIAPSVRMWLIYLIYGLAAYAVFQLLGTAWHWMLSFWAMGIVTTAGVNYMASDFASGGVTPTISGLKFHASGTGVAAAAVTDTALGTDSGVARVSGTPSNPTANQYRSVATMAYVSTLAITEWGVFSALTVGTLWDRRVFAAINVVSGDSIQFTYTLTVNNGGT